MLGCPSSGSSSIKSRNHLIVCFWKSWGNELLVQVLLDQSNVEELFSCFWFSTGPTRRIQHVARENPCSIYKRSASAGPVCGFESTPSCCVGASLQSSQGWPPNTEPLALVRPDSLGSSVGCWPRWPSSLPVSLPNSSRTEWRCSIC